MADDTGDFRNWLSDALSRRVRHPELERTLFHQLNELEHGPLERLGRLVHMAIDELGVAQRRLADQGRDLEALRTAVTDLAARVDELSRRATQPADPPAAHVLVLSTPEGYRFVERDGLPPAPGGEVEHGGLRYRVLGARHRQVPGDPRPSLLALPA